MVLTLEDFKHMSVMEKIEEKEASKPAVSTPTDLMSQTLKLCEVLRAKGFNTYANALEDKFFILKKAETDCYNVTKETGEELLEKAHPEGEVELAKSEKGHGVVETLLTQQEKDLDIVKKKPEGKHTSAQDLLTQTLLVLGALPLDESKELKEIIVSFSSIIEKAILNPLNSGNYQGIVLSNDRTVAEYLKHISAIIAPRLNQFLGFEDNSFGYVPGKTIDFVRSQVDAYLKYCIGFLKLIQESIDKGVSGFKNNKYAAQALAQFRNLQHRWYSYYNTFVSKDKGGAEWHSQYLTPEQVANIVNEKNKKLGELNSFIKNSLLQEPIVKADDKTYKYLIAMSQYLDMFVSTLNALVNSVNKYEVDNASTLNEEASKITINVIKKLLENTKIYSVLKFDSITGFNNSLDALHTQLVNNIVAEFDSNSALSSIKSTVMSRIPGR